MQHPRLKFMPDFYALDIPLHWDQELREFHDYYDHYSYLPIYVFCGKAMICRLLRRSRIDGTKHAAALIKRWITRLRLAWPQVRIIVRGDFGLCRQRLIRWDERQRAGYVEIVDGRETHPAALPRNA